MKQFCTALRAKYIVPSSTDFSQISTSCLRNNSNKTFENPSIVQTSMFENGNNQDDDQCNSKLVFDNYLCQDALILIHISKYFFQSHVFCLAVDVQPWCSMAIHLMQMSALKLCITSKGIIIHTKTVTKDWNTLPPQLLKTVTKDWNTLPPQISYPPRTITHLKYTPGSDTKIILIRAPSCGQKYNALKYFLF